MEGCFFFLCRWSIIMEKIRTSKRGLIFLKMDNPLLFIAMIGNQLLYCCFYCLDLYIYIIIPLSDNSSSIHSDITLNFCLGPLFTGKYLGIYFSPNKNLISYLSLLLHSCL